MSSLKSKAQNVS